MMSCRLADRKAGDSGVKATLLLRSEMEEFQVAMTGGFWVAAGVALAGKKTSHILTALGSGSNFIGGTFLLKSTLHSR